MRYLLLLVTVCLTLTCTYPVGAAKHALLIGVSEYKSPFQLYGPINDVGGLKEMLIQQYGFSKDNIKTLLDKEATKDGILNALIDLKDSTKEEDFIFIFFSGHGTSRYDRALGLPIGDSTGAIIPYGFNFDEEDADKKLESLIIGKRDLKPIFSSLDDKSSKDRVVFVVFDTCFSGQTVRSAKREDRIKKFVAIGGLPSGRTKIDKGKIRQRKPYPYKNVIYLAASDEDEWAYDLKSYESYDNKPHGALTGVILEALQKGVADTNNNGIVTYEELYDYLAEVDLQHGQTPQILYKRGFERPVFESTKVVQKKGSQFKCAGKDLKVKIQGDIKPHDFKDIDSIKIVQDSAKQDCYDILVEGRGDRYNLYLKNGDRLCVETGLEALEKRLKRYMLVNRLVELSNPDQDFNVFFNMSSNGGHKSVFTDRQTVDFVIKSEEESYLLLLNINSHGFIRLLLPSVYYSDNHVSEGEIVKETLGVVEPPFGVEVVKIFAFKEKIKGIEKFMRKEPIDPASGELDKLTGIIESQNGWSTNLKHVTTVKGAKR